MTTTMLLLAASLPGQPDIEVVQRPGEPAFTLQFPGPEAAEDDDPSPFLNYRLAWTVTHGDRTWTVPGYFAADGDAAETGAAAGDVWRTHFRADAPGRYVCVCRFVRGERVAVDAGADAQPLWADGKQITVTVTDEHLADSRGVLEYVDAHHLRWSRSGEWFLKSGADSPENLLAYADFDDTRSLKSGKDAERNHRGSLHRYQPHVADWTEGDPTWQDGKGKGLVGALNYLASVGVNSVYFLPMNLAGDGRDVWPYADPDDLTRFDCSRLDQWRIVFEHADRLGICLHVVLSETENESLFEVRDPATQDVPAEQAPFSDLRKLYCRELVARFGHVGGLVWNLGEENGSKDADKDRSGPGRSNTTAQRQAFAAYLKSIDPHERPVVVHTFPGHYDAVYTPLLGDTGFAGPSLQMGNMKQTHAETLKWRIRSAQAGRPWVVCLDEIGPAKFGVAPDSVDPDHNDVRRYALWGNLMAGGAGCEWYFGYQHPHNDLNLEDFRSRDAMWRQTAVATGFFRKHLPFWEMQPADALLSGDGHVLAKSGGVYAVYLPAADAVTSLTLPAGEYTLRWFDPHAGGALQTGSAESLNATGTAVSLGRPPTREGDWVALLTAD